MASISHLICRRRRSDPGRSGGKPVLYSQSQPNDLLEFRLNRIEADMFPTENRRQRNQQMTCQIGVRVFSLVSIVATYLPGIECEFQHLCCIIIAWRSDKKESTKNILHILKDLPLKKVLFISAF